MRGGSLRKDCVFLLQLRMSHQMSDKIQIKQLLLLASGGLVADI